jgi:hypothetical protein
VSESLSRLYENMIASIDSQILPRLSDDFARAQAYGLIYMLRCLHAQTSWSTEFLFEQVEAGADVAKAFADILSESADRPRPSVLDPAGMKVAELEAARDQSTREISHAYDWAQQHRTELSASAIDRLEEAYRAFLARHVKAELKRSTPINFSEISTGRAAEAE